MLAGAVCCLSVVPALATESVLLRATGPVPFVKEALVVHIDHRYAVTDHRQLVASPANQTEGVYELVTARNAVATKFSYWNGNDEIKGEIFERPDAQRMYQTVTSARRDPGLFEETAPGRFRYRIFPFAARETKRVEVRWEAWLPTEGKLVRYRAPLAHPRSSVVVDIDGVSAKTVQSRTHDVEVQATGPSTVRVRANTRRTDAPATEGFELTYEPAPTSALVHNDGREAYAVLELPPFEAKSIAAHDVTFVIDRSGSASDALPRVRAAVNDTIAHLSVRDRVNVIAFDETVTALYTSPHEISPETVRDAKAFVGSMRDGAGTDLGAALHTAFGAQEAARGRDRVIVLVTDGESELASVTKASEIGKADVRVVALQVGVARDKRALDLVTRSHGGFVEHVEPTDDLSSRLARLYHRATAARVANTRLEITGATGVDLAVPFPSSLPANEPIRIALKCRPQGLLRARVVGETSGAPVSATVDADVGKPQQRPWIAHAWAKTRMDAALAANDREAAVDVAIKHELVSKHTAFFAIPESETGRVAQQLADARAKKQWSGWASGDDVAPPTTGAGGSADATKAMDVPREMVQQSAPSPAPPSRSDERYSVSKHGGGCAGCTTTPRSNDDTTLVILGLAVAGVVACRRRKEGGR